MSNVRVQFKDFWPDFEEKENFFTSLFEKFGCKFSIVNENPDVIIFSVFGKYQHWSRLSRGVFPFSDQKVRKVFYTGEPLRKKKSLPFVVKQYDRIKNADLNLTFQNTDEYNNIRLPLWILYYFYYSTSGCHKDMTLTNKSTDKFCCFIYSSHKAHRNAFCRTLSNYKNVDCAGRCLNNIGRLLGGGPEDKTNFQKPYKFSIAFENCTQTGYTTEKMLDAYKSNCIPIYYGSETIADDFNPETFINAHEFKSQNELIDYIKEVDNNKELYQTFLNKPIFSEEWLTRFGDPNEEFFKCIVRKIMGFSDHEKFNLM
tara:strand:- start:455 stop:1396 length:942 start_codon:yes stop_codon:yes gene_type:complete